MLNQLLESRRKRERNTRGVMASAVVHAAILGTIVHATAGAKPMQRSLEREVRLPILAEPSRASPRRSGNGAVDGPGRRSWLPVPPRVSPVGIPLLGSPPPANWDSLLATSSDIGSAAGPTQRSTTETPGTGAFSGAVDVMARPLATNPAPVYPRSLRSLGVEGTISATFVVDTTGRVDLSSITFASGGNDLFEQSVRQALGAARFAPALAGMQKVRVLVGQSFQFRIER